MADNTIKITIDIEEVEEKLDQLIELLKEAKQLADLFNSKKVSDLEAQVQRLQSSLLTINTLLTTVGRTAIIQDANKINLQVL